MLNTEKIIQEYSEKINPYYDLTVSDIMAIKHIDMGVFELISNSFTFGYAQGRKATLAEMKNKTK